MNMSAILWTLNRLATDVFSRGKEMDKRGTLQWTFFWGPIKPYSGHLSEKFCQGPCYFKKRVLPLYRFYPTYFNATVLSN